MAARTIENWRDRLVTILVLPLLTCSARLPVYAMIAALLFGDQPLYAGLMFAAAYSLGLGAALLTAWCLKKTVLTGEAAPLVIELPPYRMPSLRNALLITFDRASVFIRKAGSIILLISVILWAMATYPKLPDQMLASAQSTSEFTQAQQALEYSFAGRAGKAMEPIFAPLGFDWKINVAVVSSFAAREVLVSTLSIVYGLGEQGGEDDAGLTETMRRQTLADGSPVFTTATCVSLLVFYVLAMQCLPTQAVTRRETGSWKWAFFQFGYMTLLAYGSAWIAYHGCIAAGLAISRSSTSSKQTRHKADHQRDRRWFGNSAHFGNNRVAPETNRSTRVCNPRGEILFDHRRRAIEDLDRKINKIDRCRSVPRP